MELSNWKYFKIIDKFLESFDGYIYYDLINGIAKASSDELLEKINDFISDFTLYHHDDHIYKEKDANLKEIQDEAKLYIEKVGVPKFNFFVKFTINLKKDPTSDDILHLLKIRRNFSKYKKYVNYFYEHYEEYYIIIECKTVNNEPTFEMQYYK